MRALLPSWSPVTRHRLPFETRLFASSNDSFCSLERSHAFAAAWGTEVTNVGPSGHLNADSGLGDWPQAHEQLLQLMRDTSADAV